MNRTHLVRDIYHRGVIVCRPDTPLHELVRTMADTEIHAVMVSEGEGEIPVGVVSHTDVVAHYGKDLSAIHARDVMTRNVISVSETDTVEAAVKRLLEHGINRMLVVDEEGKPLGILSTTDIIRDMRDTRWVWHLT